jgi:hypothetical protein
VGGPQTGLHRQLSRIHDQSRYSLQSVPGEARDEHDPEVLHPCFFDTHATIANITDDDVIRCFQNRLFSKHTYHDFGRHCPTTAVELRDMVARWADQEDEENDRFLKHNHDK